jgi:hypothetical protein
MTDSSREEVRKKIPKKWITRGMAGIVLVALASLTTGGMVWHGRPGFCSICHTPMKSYVGGYVGGDKTLMVTKHATAKVVIKCLDCHNQTTREQATEAIHWVTGNYDFPLKQRVFGTRAFCLASGCHDEATVVKKTTDYGGAVSYNQHDPRHGRLECYRCHSMHGKSVLMCNQCHNLKLPEGWVSPAATGAVAAR